MIKLTKKLMCVLLLLPWALNLPVFMFLLSWVLNQGFPVFNGNGFVTLNDGDCFAKAGNILWKKTLARLKLLAQFYKTYLLLRSICFQWHLVRKHFCVICSHNNTAISFPSVSARMFCRRDIEVIAGLSVAIREKA